MRTHSACQALSELGASEATGKHISRLGRPVRLKSGGGRMKPVNAPHTSKNKLCPLGLPDEEKQASGIYKMSVPFSWMLPRLGMAHRARSKLSKALGAPRKPSGLLVRSMASKQRNHNGGT